MPGTGRVHIKSIRSYSGTSPLAKLTEIIVYSFAATQEEVELNKSALNRIRMRVSSEGNDEKAKLAHKIVNDFSQSLITDLQRLGLPVS